MQRAAQAGTSEERWAWLDSEAGFDDPFTTAAFVREAPRKDPRRGVMAARLRTLQRRLEASPAALGPS